jgi:hypothetical protein
MAPAQMLKELIRVGAVVKLETGNFRVVRREFEPERLSPELLERFGDVAHNFFSTAATNIEKKGQRAGLFERVVYAEESLSDEILEQFDEFVKSRGQDFLEELDNWFVLRQGMSAGASKTQETGFGMYHYVENKHDKESLRDLLVERGLEPEDNLE